MVLFKKRSWKPFAFQRKAWDAWGKRFGACSDGNRKTYAVWMPSWNGCRKRGARPSTSAGLRVLWRPTSALVADTTRPRRVKRMARTALDVESRTGDTSGSVKAKQRHSPVPGHHPPACLCCFPIRIRARPFPIFGQSSGTSGMNCFPPQGEPKPSFAWPVFADGTPGLKPGASPQPLGIWKPLFQPCAEKRELVSSSTAT